MKQQIKQQNHANGHLTFDSLPDWVTPGDARRYLNISRSAIYELLRSQKIPSKRWGQRCIRIPKAALAPRVEELAGV